LFWPYAGRRRTLVASGPVQHAEDLEDVAVAVVAAEFVARAVETEHNLPSLPPGGGSAKMAVWHRHGSDWAGWHLDRDELAMGLKMGVDAEASGLEMALMSSARAAGPQVEAVHCSPC
jgi:hypothetical protein